MIFTGTGVDALRWTWAAILAAYALAVTAIFAALNTIFRAAVYNYATAGVAPVQMDSALLQSTFHHR